MDNFLIAGYFLGLFIFALNGIVLLGMYRRVTELRMLREDVVKALIQYKIRRHR